MAKVDLAGRLEEARSRVEAETPTEDRGLAKFARLTRKDARLRPDQDAALAAVAKSLMRRRAVKTERITENTLIRVAIDLLLAHADSLRGSTEDELRESVTSETSSSRTSGLPSSATPMVADFRASDAADTGLSLVADSRGGGAATSRAAGFGAPFYLTATPTGREVPR